MARFTSYLSYTCRSEDRLKSDRIEVACRNGEEGQISWEKKQSKIFVSLYGQWVRGKSQRWPSGFWPECWLLIR